eukprot:1585341-Amphidinium_carterae.1
MPSTPLPGSFRPCCCSRRSVEDAGGSGRPCHVRSFHGHGAHHQTRRPLEPVPQVCDSAGLPA